MNYVLLNGDMKEQAHKIKDGSIDFILTDPPYGISKDFKPEWKDKDGNDLNTIHDHQFDRAANDNWDSAQDFIQHLNQWVKVCSKKLRKNGSIAIFVGDRYISHFWEAFEKYGITPKRVITWRKPAAVPFNRKVLMLSACEFLIYGIKEGKGTKKKVFNADPTTNSTPQETFVMADKAGTILNSHIQKYYPEKSLEEIMQMVEKTIKKNLDSIIQTDGTTRLCIPNIITYSGGGGKNRIHPTEKPTEILKYLISIFSNRGDIIFDPFAGSGSTGEASLSLDREVILIEKDNDYCKKIETRLAALGHICKGLKVKLWRK